MSIKDSFLQLYNFPSSSTMAPLSTDSYKITQLTAQNNIKRLINKQWPRLAHSQIRYLKDIPVTYDTLFARLN